MTQRDTKYIQKHLCYLHTFLQDKPKERMYWEDTYVLWGTNLPSLLQLDWDELNLDCSSGQNYNPHLALLNYAGCMSNQLYKVNMT